MAWPSTLTWKLAETLQLYLSKNSPFRGADMKAEFDNIYNAINYLAANGMGEAVADVAALRAVPDEAAGPTASDVPRRDGQLRRVNSVIGPSSSTSTQIYQFKAASATADADAGNLDTDGVIAPTSGTGRWHRVPSNAIYNRGADSLVTFFRNGITDLNTDTYGDIAWQYIGKSASSLIKLTFNKALHIRDGSDAGYQDILIKALTASSNISGAGTNNTLTGTPTASATAGLLQLGLAPVGANAAGNYQTINTAGGYSGDLINYQVNGVVQEKTDASGNKTLAGNVIAAGTNNKFNGSPSASATEALIRAINALSGGNANGTIFGANAANGYLGDLINLQVNNTSKFKVNKDGLVTAGTDASAGLELVTYQQMTAAITNANKAKLQFAQRVASSFNNGLTTEQSLLTASHGSLTIASADVLAGTCLKLDIHGYWRNSDNTSEDVTVRIKAGGVTLATIVFNSSTTTNQIRFRAHINLIFQNKNASGTVHYDYSFEPQYSSALNTTDWNVSNSYGIGSGTVDTTGTVAIDITGQEDASISGTTGGVWFDKVIATLFLV